jgi:hypothetical protein
VIRTGRGMPASALAVTFVAVVTSLNPAAAAMPRHEHAEKPSKHRTWHGERLAKFAVDRSIIRADQRTGVRSDSGHPDIDGDGLADLLVQSSGPDAGALRTYADTGTPWADTSVDSAQHWLFADMIVLADVTGDDRADVLARDPGVANGTLWVYPNTGDSADRWPTRFSAGTGWNIARTLLVGDVSGDGNADLVARDSTTDNGTLRVYRGNGSTTSNPWTTSPIWSGTGWNTVGPIMLADATADGRPDIIARTNAGDIFVYPHNGATDSNYWTSIVVGSVGWPTTEKLAAIDATGDDLPDLVAVDRSGTAWLHPQLSTSARSMWSPTERREVASGLTYAAEILPGDVDGNGRPELSARVAAGGELSVRIHNGDAAANPWTASTSEGTAWGFASEVLLGDVDGDGRKDLLALDRSDANGTVWIYRNTGDPGERFTARYFGGNGWNIFTELIVGDVNGDGLADLVGRTPDGDLYAYPGNGSATGFPWQQRVWVGSNWQTADRLALGDLDGDAIDDLVDLELDGSLWLFPTGASTDPIQVDGAWSTVESIGLGDTTGTGRLDLVVRNDDGSVQIFVNTGATGGNPWRGPSRSGGSGYAGAQSFVI